MNSPSISKLNSSVVVSLGPKDEVRVHNGVVYCSALIGLSQLTVVWALAVHV